MVLRVDLPGMSQSDDPIRPDESPIASAPPPGAAAVVARGESPVRFGVLMAIGVTLLFQFGAQAVLLRFRDLSMLPYVMAASQLLLMLAPAIYAARAQELPARELFRLRPVPAGMHIAVILGIIMLWPIVQSYLIIQELYLIPDGLFNDYRELQRRLEGLYETLMPPGTWMAPLISLIAGALVPGICEEAVFRGATQRSFERRMRPAFAIVLAALLFAGLHLQPHNVVPLTILGSFLGLAAWASRSVYPAILGHFFFNALMVGALYTMRAQGERSTPHSEDDLLALLPGVLICIVGLGLVVRWLLLRGRGHEAELILSDATIASESTQTSTDEQ